MQDRRAFIKLSAAGLLGMAFQDANMEETYELAVPDLRAASWSKIQKQFKFDKGVTFMNNGTMGINPLPVQRAVADRISYISRRGSYGGLEMMAQKKIAEYIGAEQQEIALTHNVSEGINFAAWALPMEPGDEVILTNHEHVGNALPWLNRKEIDGIKLVVAEIQPDSKSMLDEIIGRVTSKTKVIAVPHILCTTGQVLPVKEICAYARSKGIYTFIDGAHGIGMLPLDMHDLDCDMYISCGHKWLLAPSGTGIIYVREASIEDLTPRFVGGHSDKKWVLSNEEAGIEGYNPTAHRFYYGTQSSPLFAGLIAAVEFGQSIGQDRIWSYISSLNNYLYEQLEVLQEEGKLSILTPKEKQSRGGIISARLVGDNLEFYKSLSLDSFIIRYVAESDLNCVRISTHIYNTKAQVDELIKRIRAYA